jgi:hypothetical protein
MKVMLLAKKAAFCAYVASIAFKSSISLVSGRTTRLLRGEPSSKCRSIVCFTRLDTLLAYTKPCKAPRHQRFGARARTDTWACRLLGGRGRCGC